ncbi:dicarboxylate/amino acid:cation symporter [Cellvibrio japonicus]|uniref:Excitatory amino acid transporter n=1 Tax=Cellvibrio japonicus (strain Ueda107) TaxID=498211 RepID=B3PF66_CELJU|nr:dicarboxylate/amino acid:cation symporter [Cellvibrio japonicus]ACE84690.1 excitatory amino acid transporter [Cellvibrio japonicus Ueda107]QEI13621.1 dicarboxylate/amino acid:cation symporter [Cellvibrio japonicus]QEI17195.1 dicarboxylate/amino acid:cation symporter [Cellvibrio japonicus]QEI20772.1 dicarboxylate/amino acid:cation symporter [Cellvibrio japonicus]
MAKGFSWPSLNVQIFLAALLGLAIGYGLQGLQQEHEVRVTVLYFSNLAGNLFIDLLKMVLVPLIFASIVVGISSLQRHHQARRVWQLTLVFFVCTMALAIVLALVMTNLVKPGQGITLAMFSQYTEAFAVQSFSPGDFASQFLRSLFQNPFAALAQGNILAVVTFAIILGVALVMGGENCQTVVRLLEELLSLLMRIVGWIMWLAPLGIVALLTRLVATQDSELLGSLGGFIVLIFATTLIHGVVVLPLILYLFTRKSPLWFWRGARPALITAFATSSSSATLPITLQCTDQMGVSQRVSRFVVPLGATINMDGTALYEAAAALFVANLVGVDLSLGQQLVVMLMAMVASLGAPGIPSAGMVTMVMVLQAVGLPAEAIAILLPIDRLLDTIRTSVNVQGDMIGSVLVDHWVAAESNPQTER